MRAATALSASDTRGAVQLYVPSRRSPRDDLFHLTRLGLQEDYPAWAGAKPAQAASAPRSLAPLRAFDGVTEAAAQFTNKHSGVPALHQPAVALTRDLPLHACTMYGKEYIAKPMPAQYNACKDRAWMNCDTCYPTEVPTPAGDGNGPGEMSWTSPPYATGRAKFDGRTEHKAEYRRF